MIMNIQLKSHLLNLFHSLPKHKQAKHKRLMYNQLKNAVKPETLAQAKNVARPSVMTLSAKNLLHNKQNQQQ